jgi:hypothetical protein
MIWDQTHGMRNLEDIFVEFGLGPAITGWDLEFATAVSDDGQTIVGWGFNPTGAQEAWIARLGSQSVVEVQTASGTMLALFAGLLVAAAFVTLRLR